MSRNLCLGIACLLLSIVTACQPIVGPTGVVSPLNAPVTVEIPFETISLNEWGENSSVSWETQLFLVTNQEQVAPLETLVNAEDFAQLQQVDYAADAVIALFRGRRGSSNYQTIIERIERVDGYLVVHAQLWSPGSHWASADVVTGPYHLVRIHKANLPSTEVELALAVVAITPTPPASVKD